MVFIAVTNAAIFPTAHIPAIMPANTLNIVVLFDTQSPKATLTVKSLSAISAAAESPAASLSLLSATQASTCGKILFCKTVANCVTTGKSA